VWRGPCDPRRDVEGGRRPKVDDAAASVRPSRAVALGISLLAVRDHVRCYMRAAFTPAADPALADRRLAATAHAFGYRGHCLTKSRRYSTTFKAPREARERHVREQLLACFDDAGQRALAGAVERVASFRYVGRGHLRRRDALLASSAAARAREQRRAAREALCDHARTREET
jgi:hypothetical protein